MGRIIWLIAALALTLVGASLAGAVTIDWVPIGNPGNPADTAIMTTDHTTGYGAVAYNYSIDKYDVTVGQYTDFLNAVAATRYVRALQHVDGRRPQHCRHRPGRQLGQLYVQRDRLFGQSADHLRQLGGRGPICQLAGMARS